jgi:hypothetical protein
MTNSTSPLLVVEYTSFTLTCLTDEGNPTPSVSWSVNGKPISTGITNKNISGYYNAMKIKSTFTAAAVRAQHNDEYKCTVFGTNISTEYILHVNCKFSFQSFSVTIFYA